MLPFDALLKPVSAEQPSGEDRTYHPALNELETLLQGAPGEGGAAPEEPRWRDVRDQAIEFLRESKHLRVAVILNLALLREEGVTGFRDGLQYLERLLKEFWPSLYPQLDPEDNNDPTARINLLNSLGAPLGTYLDPYRFIENLRRAPLAVTPARDVATLRDVIIARNPPSAAPEGEGKTPLTTDQIKAIFRDAAPEEIKNTHGVLAEALAAVQGTDKFLDETVGAGNSANFEELKDTLKDALKTLAEFLPGEAAADATAEGADGGSAEGAVAKKGGGFVAGRIDTREEVIKALHAIIDYYRREEPSSPIPYLVKRAQRMVPMSFIDLMNEMAPDSLTQVRVITGPDDATPAS